MTSFHASSAGIAIERFALMAKEHPEAAAWDIASLKRVLRLTIDVIAHMEAQPVLDSHGVGRQTLGDDRSLVRPAREGRRRI